MPQPKNSGNGKSDDKPARIPLREQVKSEHPDWDDAKVTEEVSRRRQRERRERFEKVGVRRTRNTLKSLKALENVGNPNVYEYRPDEVEKILSALDEAVTRVHNAFRGVVSKDEEFSL